MNKATQEQKSYRIEASSSYIGQRWLEVAAQVFPQLQTISKARRERKKGRLTLNDQAKVDTAKRLEPNDVLQLQIEVLAIVDHMEVSKATKNLQALTKQGIQVIYENCDFAVINKPAGFHVKGFGSRNVEAILADCLIKSSSEDCLPYPTAVHRLDARVSGLLLIAKRRSIDAFFCRAFAQRQVKKRYRALLVGKLTPRNVQYPGEESDEKGENEPGTYRIGIPIDGRPSISFYRVVEYTESHRYGWLTTVDLYPFTGRKHQLRIHMASLGHPIIGDDLYHSQTIDLVIAAHQEEHVDISAVSSRLEVLKYRGLFLQAVELNFPTPNEGYHHFQIDEMKKIQSYRRMSRKKFLQRTTSEEQKVSLAVDTESSDLIG